MQCLNTAGVSLERIKTEMMKDKEFKKEYDKMQPYYEAVTQNVGKKVSEKSKGFKG